MALPTVQDCKDMLRIQHAADDAMLAGWLVQAQAACEAEMGRPITLLSRTFVLEFPRDAVSALHLYVPIAPVAAGLVLTDGNDTTLVEGVDYRVDQRTGIVTSLTGGFGTYPYTIVAEVGLEGLAEYATRIEPAMAAALLDTVADRYQHRNPAATAEAEGSVSTTYAESGLPQRVVDLLAPWTAWRL